MRLLFVKLKHIGDSLLLTPTLTATRAAYPDAQIWVAVRRGCEGILAGCPAIDHVVTAAAPEAARRSPLNFWHDWLLIRKLRRHHFDYAFELSDGDRGRWLCAFSGASFRATNCAGRPLNRWWRRHFDLYSAFAWQDRHRVEKDFFTVHDCLPLGTTVPPLTFARDRAITPSLGQFAGRYAVLHPGTRWKRKRWPRERWIEVGAALLEQLPQLIISAGPDPEEITLARELCAALGSRVRSTEGQLDWRHLAGLLYEAALFVGVDTAAMHLAAACQCPTVAIFGPSNPIEWRPWEVAHRLIAPGAQARMQLPPERLIEGVPASEVIQACRELVSAPPPGLATSAFEPRD